MLLHILDRYIRSAETYILVRSAWLCKNENDVERCPSVVKNGAELQQFIVELLCLGAFHLIKFWYKSLLSISL